MDSDEDILDIEVDDYDLEGMELDAPALELEGGERIGQIPQEQSAVTPAVEIDEQLSSEADKTKKKRKWKSKNPLVLEKKREKR